MCALTQFNFSGLDAFTLSLQKLFVKEMVDMSLGVRSTSCQCS